MLRLRPLAKSEEEERKRAEAEELKLKIQAAKEEAKNLYSIFVEYVKTNSATDVLRLNELYVRAPEINLSWDKKIWMTLINSNQKF